jgi:putative ABC transport system ATP-binding protein
MEIIIEAKNLGKTYRLNKTNQRPALVDINLQITRGEFTAVMGPSGSGKSTLLHNLSGMDRMTGGSVDFLGTRLGSLSEEKLAALRLRGMGFIFQQIHLLKNLSIMDNILAPAYLANGKPRREINRRAIELMEKTGIAGLADNDITQASGGQLQRAGICRALINSPEVIFGDEPTGALDSRSAVEIMDILAEINRTGTTIVLVTHDVKVAARAERVLFMRDGRIDREYRMDKWIQENGGTREREEALARLLLEAGSAGKTALPRFFGGSIFTREVS